jgi:hypothetical protein
MNYENWGAFAQDRSGPGAEKKEEARSPKSESSDIAKLTQVIFDHQI